MIKYILITSILSVGGQPDIETSNFTITNSDKECIELMGNAVAEKNRVPLLFQLFSKLAMIKNHLKRIKSCL